jgi:hypothetical protein
VKGVAILLENLCDLGEELLLDLGIDEDDGGSHANLTGVHESADDSIVCSQRNIGIVENDLRRLASELEDARLENLRGFRSNQTPHTRRACEVDLANGWVSDECACHLDDVFW